MEPTFHWGRNNFICKFSGNVNDEDIKTGLAKFSRDERSHSIDYGIIDFSEIESFNTQDRDIRIAAAHDIGFSLSRGQPTKFAFIASDPMATQFFNSYKEMVQSVDTKLQVQIFDNRESAMEWVT